MTSTRRYTSPLHWRNGNSHAGHTSDPVESYGILSQEHFARTLYVERKRTERSGRSFVLMLLESSRLLNAASEEHALENVLLALSSSTRDTDIQGWHNEGTTIGVIFTELGADVDGRSVANALLTKVVKALTSTLSINQINEIKLSFRVFPEHWDDGSPIEEVEPTLYHDLTHNTAPKVVPRLVKRSMDVVGSLLALIFGLPVFLGVALVIKLTSKGPVFSFGSAGSGFMAESSAF